MIEQDIIPFDIDQLDLDRLDEYIDPVCAARRGQRQDRYHLLR